MNFSLLSFGSSRYTAGAAVTESDGSGDATYSVVAPKIEPEEAFSRDGSAFPLRGAAFFCTEISLYRVVE
jgi:hypothetical protein